MITESSTNNYIINNRLILDSFPKSELKIVFEEILKYIYQIYHLHHQDMCILYKKTSSIFNYDSIEVEPNTKSKYEKFKFKPNSKIDSEYVYYDYIERFDEFFYPNYLNLIKEIHLFLDSNEETDLKFGNIFGINISNKTGPNTSLNGIRSADWKLHYWDTYEIFSKTEISFDDLIVAAYKIKSHKFDTIYEEFSSIDNMDLVANQLAKTTTNNIMYMDVNFIHNTEWSTLFINENK